MVPVHFKSNITKTFAVGVPGSKAKEELELWRAEPYRTKSKATEAAHEFAELSDALGLALRDGMLLRSEPDNLSDAVYRLKLGQAVKLLRKTSGKMVETGGTALEGSWYLALANDGTSGYIFSNQLEIWNANEGPMPDIQVRSSTSGESLSAFFDTVWRPDYFESMSVSGRLDLAAFQARFGIFADPLRKNIRVERPEFSKVYRYDSIMEKEDGSFEIVPGGASFSLSGTGSLLFIPAEADVSAEALARAKEDRGPDAFVSYTFMRFERDVTSLVAAEERIRLSRLSAFVAGGERFESEAYGVLIITRSARFTWVAYGALSPFIIPDDSGETGSISMDLYLSPELETDWDGAFTLRFDGGTKPAVSFAYQMQGDELIPAHVPPDARRNAVIMATAELEPVAALKKYR
ncbi:SH3 domain-containing protein [Spirochaetota bacterium]